MAHAEIVSGKLLVAAIDLGIGFSSCLFQSRADFHKDPLRMHGLSWVTDSNEGFSWKTPTRILFNPSMTFDSFGIEAEIKYSELVKKDEQRNWYYFMRFSMDLYRLTNIPPDLTLEDVKGKHFPAIKVISASINYLREQMMTQIKIRDVIIGPDDINWVIIVPAICSDAVQNFMREATLKAGIPNSQLMLVLEPEAASIFCKHAPSERMVVAGKYCMDAFSPGTKYLILDARGDRVIITVQEVQTDSSIKQKCLVHDENCGGTKVDKAFTEFLQEVVGAPAVDVFFVEDKVGYRDLLREFEIKKLQIRPDQTSHVTLKVPISLRDAFELENGCDLQNYPSRSPKRVTFVGDKLRIEPDYARQLFKPICECITEHMKQIFSDSRVTATNVILMVGEFSESPILQDVVQKVFPDKTIVIPHDAGMAVLKGAVLFGYDTRLISTKICKATYDMRTASLSHKGSDKEGKKIENNIEAKLDLEDEKLQSFEIRSKSISDIEIDNIFWRKELKVALKGLEKFKEENKGILKRMVQAESDYERKKYAEENESLKRELATTKLNLKRFEERYKKERETASHKDENYKQLMQENDRLKQDVTAVKSQYIKLRKETDHLIADFKDESDNNKQTISRLRQECEDLLAKSEAKTHQQNSYELKICKTEKEQLKEALAEQKQNNLKLENKLRDLERKRLKCLQCDEYEKTTVTLKKDKIQLQDKCRVIDELLRKPDKETHQFQVDINKLQFNIITYKQEIDSLNTRIEILRKEKSDLEARTSMNKGNNKIPNIDDTVKKDNPKIKVRETGKLQNQQPTLINYSNSPDLVQAFQKKWNSNTTETSLPDPDRPANLGRQFSELFEDEWSEALSELHGDKRQNTDYLRYIVMESYLFAKTCANQYLNNLDNAILQINRSVQSFVSESQHHIKYGPRVTCFIKKLVPLCFKMVLLEPPIVPYTQEEGHIDPCFEPYPELSGEMNFVIWPALYLQEGGIVLCKGIAGGAD